MTNTTVAVPEKRADAYAAKFLADTCRLEQPRCMAPTDENLAVILANCARRPRPE